MMHTTHEYHLSAQRTAARDRFATALRIHEAAIASDCLCSVDLGPSHGAITITGSDQAASRALLLLPADLRRSARVTPERVEGGLAIVTISWRLGGLS